MLRLLVALLLAPLSLALSDPHEELISLAAANNGVIQLNDQNFDLITSPKREWSATIQLTALDKSMKCAPCKDFDPSFIAVASAWKSLPKAERNKHFFATLDFKDGKDTFKKLNVMSAPVVTFYPAAQGPQRPASGKTDPFNYDFSNFGTEAKELASWVSTFTPKPVPYRVPTDWSFVLSIVSTTVMAAITARLMLPVLLNRWTWAFFTIMTILTMISGFMFVRIRGMPYRTAEHTMIPGFQNQVGQEILTVASKYFLLSASFLVLILGAPHQANSKYQRPAIYICSAIIIFLFSALVSDFKIKNGGYPFTYVF